MTRERDARPRREAAPPRDARPPVSQHPPRQRPSRSADAYHHDRPSRAPSRNVEGDDYRRPPRPPRKREAFYGEPANQPRPPRGRQYPADHPMAPRYSAHRQYEEPYGYNTGRPQTQLMRPPIEEASQKPSGKKRLFLLLYNLIFYSFTIGILATALLFAFSNQTDASVLDYRFYQVLTDSMAPVEGAPEGGFYSGDMVVVKMMPGSEVQPGDIVTYQLGAGKNYLTHRMVERLTELNGEPGDYIVTKGDANNSNDPPIKAERVHGKVIFVVPKVGTLVTFVRESFWLCLTCALSIFGFFLVLKAYFLAPADKKDSAKDHYHAKRI